MIDYFIKKVYSGSFVKPRVIIVFRAALQKWKRMLLFARRQVQEQEKFISLKNRLQLHWEQGLILPSPMAE
jgi:hypothetical protein